jgi:chromosome segregation ATPase
VKYEIEKKENEASEIDVKNKLKQVKDKLSAVESRLSDLEEVVEQARQL